MARTSKMNMIMHGDGHVGVYLHDGLLNVGGVYDSSFDIVLINPPLVLMWRRICVSLILMCQRKRERIIYKTFRFGIFRACL